jgi:serine phosphatase RsbU (regulator of sigma subunit)
MVELRHALRAYALDSAGPAGVLNRLERMLRHYHRREYATLCLMVLDTAAGRLDVACAGHPPPLLVAADGATYAEAAGPMLGLGLEHRQEVSLPLAPVETIVLYTDGLVEDRPADIDAALERLRTWPGLRADADDLCDDLLAHFGRTRSDDIAVLVLRRADTPV